MKKELEEAYYLIAIKMKKDISKTIIVPENIEVRFEKPKLTVQGPLGKTERIFNIKNIEIKIEDKKITVGKKEATKKDKKNINSVASHITNMIVGVTKGFEYRLQICSIHFPITINIDKQKNLLVIKNFLGENKNRTVKMLPNTEVAVEGDIITVKALDKEVAGQQAANIETATRIRARDRRVFQDGIWIIKKEKGRG